MSILRDRRIAALLAAEVISSLGTQMTWIALPWFVLRETGSPQRMTWVIIAEILPHSHSPRGAHRAGTPIASSGSQVPDTLRIKDPKSGPVEAELSRGSRTGHVRN